MGKIIKIIKKKQHQKILFIFILCIIANHSQNIHSLFQNNDRIPSGYSSILIISENEKGRLLSFEFFRKGVFQDANDYEKKSLMTTMLTDTGTFLFDYLKKNFNDFEPSVISPNGYGKTSFSILFKFSNNEIFLVRRMKDPNVLFNDMMAAEKPENYQVIIGFKIKDKMKLNTIIKEIKNYCIKKKKKIISENK
jgi:hypothetical protein